jgi:EAL domain-containing protein (putative c-di-GMP-specific phosphodiesterase class I)/GGDEF domain-containing protein
VRFATKLALVLAITLVVIQVATGLAIYSLIRDTLVDQGKVSLTTARDQLIRQLGETERQLADGVQVLTLDFALRQSIAAHDRATVVSALRNHGRRVGAKRLWLIETDGTIGADTGSADIDGTGEKLGSPDGSKGIGHALLKASDFEFPALLEKAGEQERAAMIALVDGIPVRLVVVPVLAPDPIAYIAAVLPLDDEFLAQMRLLAGLPEATGLATGAGGEWRVTAGPIADLLARQRASGRGTILGDPTIIGSPGDETIFLATVLAATPGDPVVAAVMGYPLSQALRPYRSLAAVLLTALGTGLLGTLLGAALIARRVARPIELLAIYARRIETGDYRVPPVLRQGDEVGQLSAALSRMTQGIAEREDRIRHQARHDPVTGLPNRQALMEAMAGLPGGCPAVVLVIALVRLQVIANTVGRDIANRLMRDAAGRIAGLAGENLLGCIGERSFAVVLSDCDAAEGERRAARIIDAFEQPYRETDLTVDAGVGIGLALSPAHGTDAAILLRRAEVAQQVAVSANVRQALYRPETDPHRPELLSLMSDLRQGIQRGELELVYQPKLDLRTRRIIGAEALVRWNHPTRGMVMPDDFIGLAEETGNVHLVTRWALAAGVAQAGEWRRQGLDLRIAINLSVRDLEDKALPDQIAALLAGSELAPEALMLEVTESALIHEVEAAISVLGRLADQGIGLSIDDFGAGQSSLTYLRRLPVREVKIDKAFVLKLAQFSDDRTIVRAVVDLGHRLGYAVTAEGVEDAASLEILSSFGCDYAQGYFIARPLQADRFIRLLEDRQAETVVPDCTRPTEQGV